MTVFNYTFNYFDVGIVLLIILPVVEDSLAVEAEEVPSVEAAEAEASVKTK